MVKTVVIGGGIAGATTAWYLLRAGHAVTLIDRAPSLAGEGSHANGAMLHAGAAEPWNSPATLAVLLGWAAGGDSPVRVMPRELPGLFGWGGRFLWYSRAAAYRRALERNTRLARYSRQLMPALGAALGGGWDHQARGILRLCRSQPSLARLHRLADRMAALGTRAECLDRAGVVAREPALADTAERIAGGVFFPDDEAGDACAFVQRLGERMEADGLDLRLGTTVETIEQAGGGVAGIVTDRGRVSADCYVLAAGGDAPLLARRLGIELPIRPVKGHSATLTMGATQGLPSIPIIDGDRKIVITRLGRRLRIAGGAEFAGHDRSIPAPRVRRLVEQVLTDFPACREHLRAAPHEAWSCLRPVTVDGPPILGPTPLVNLHLNTGGGHLGWTIAAGCARVVADFVDGRRPEIDVTGLMLRGRH